MQKCHWPRRKTSLDPFLLKYIAPKIWSEILGKLISLSPYANGKNTELTCYLSEFPVDFRHVSVKMCWCPFVSLPSFTSTDAYPTKPLDIGMLLPSVFCLFTHFISRWLDAYCYFSFITREISIKNWFVPPTGLVERLTHFLLFCQPFVIQIS